MSVQQQDTEPVPLARAVDDLLERLHIADQQMQLRMEFYRMGYAAAERDHADDYGRGYAAAIADIKRTDRQLVNALDRAHARWSVRGQQRSRQTYGQPHPNDYPGIGNGAA